MKKDYTYLDELTDKSKNYKVKVKVIQKARPKQSPGKKKRQQLIFEDDKGNTMRGAIFEDDIPIFEEAIQRNGEYEISDAVIAPVPVQFQKKQNEFQMNLNRRIKLTPIHAESSGSGPRYTTINEIPRNEESSKTLLDIIGVVLFVSDIRHVKLGDSSIPVRDIIITDNSTQHPLILTLWDDLAENDCELFNNWSTAFQVVGFTAMRIGTYKGLSISSSMSTEILFNPENDRSNSLHQWAIQNDAILKDRQAMILIARESSQKRIISTIAEVNAKMAANTWHEQKYWIKVTLPEAHVQDLYLYIGCNKCGRKSQTNKGVTYTCTHCNHTAAISVPRVSFTFIATDHTGTKKFTIFTQDVETLLGITSSDLHDQINSGNSSQIEEKLKQLQTTEVYLQISPSNNLNANRVLSWVVRQIGFE